MANYGLYRYPFGGCSSVLNYLMKQIFQKEEYVDLAMGAVKNSVSTAIDKKV